jgi:peptide/nickel transport system substrate-binding protein
MFFTPKKPKKGGKQKEKLERLAEDAAKMLPTKAQLRHIPKVLSKKERYLILSLALIAVLALLAIPVSAYYHFTKPAPAYGGSFSEGLVGTPKYINPLLLQTNDSDRDLSELVYSGLMKFNGQGNVDLDLAKSYDVSDDGLTYTFHLKDNLKWQDGQPLTADDIIFTILTAQNTDYSSPQIINWLGVTISKLDNQTVTFKLKNKYAQFINNLTIGILPQHVWENVKPSAFGLSEFNIKPLGSGPYKFSRVRRDSLGNISSLELVTNDKYYAGKPYISKITFRFYESEDTLISAYNSSQVDNLGFISSQNLNSIRFAGQLQVKRLELPRYFAVFFNQSKNTFLADKNIRSALSYGTDKKAILHQILADKGTVVDSPMLPGIIDIPDDVTKYAFDPERAKKILDDGGWKYSETDKVREKAAPTPKGKNAVAGQPTKLEIELTTPNSPELSAVAAKLQEQWGAIGVNVHVRSLDPSELTQARKNRDYQSLLFGEVLGLDPDPFSFWHSSQKKDPGLNLAMYDNKDADKLLEDARQTLDDSARMSKYDDFQKLVTKDIPAIFIYSPDYIYPQTARIKGNDSTLIFVPSDRFDAANKWYINTKRVLK